MVVDSVSRVTSSVLNYLHFLPLSRVALRRMNSMIGAGVGAPLSVRMSRGSPVAADHPGGRRSVADPLCFSGFPPSVRPSPRKKLRCGFRSFLISCESSRGSSGGRPGGDGEGTDKDYLPASLLVAGVSLNVDASDRIVPVMCFYFLRSGLFLN